MSVFNDGLPLESLPPVIAQIAAAIGIDPTEALIKHYSGFDLYIPKTIPDDHGIAIAIGHEAAKLLSDEFGGRQIKIARCEAARRHTRDIEIFELRTVRKWKLHLIARQTGLTISRICRILQEQNGNAG